MSKMPKMPKMPKMSKIMPLPHQALRLLLASILVLFLVISGTSGCSTITLPDGTQQIQPSKEELIASAEKLINAVNWVIPVTDTMMFVLCDMETVTYSKPCAIYEVIVSSARASLLLVEEALASYHDQPSVLTQQNLISAITNLKNSWLRLDAVYKGSLLPGEEQQA